MISQINITVNAAKPKFPLPPMVAFNGSPSSVRISGVPCSIGNWSISTVRVLVSYPNNFTVEKTAVKVDNFWIATIDGSQVNGVIKNGFQVIADGVDENNLPVNGYVLGVGDVVVLPRDKGIEKLVDRYAVRYLNEPPVNPSIGDMLNLNGQFKVWDGSKWVSVSGEDIEVYDSAITLQANGVQFDSFTVNASQAKTIDIPVPSKTSELDNDSGFITSAAIPSKVSELDNDSGFITASAIPSQISSFENDVGYITSWPVIPATGTFTGFAQSAFAAAQLNANDGINGFNDHTTLTLNTYGNTFVRTEYFPSWHLAKYYDAEYSPSVEMVWTYIATITYKVSGRIRNIGVQRWGWKGSDGNGVNYFLTSTEEDQWAEDWTTGKFYKWTSTTTPTTKDITLSSDKLSIETIDGLTDQITCTRNSKYTSFHDKVVAYTDQIPSSVSQLTNDVGYITASAIPSDISAFNNDVGYLSAVTWNDVSGKPNIPSNTSDLVNDSGFVTASTVAASYYNKTEIDGMIGSINTILDNINGEVI